MGLNRVFRVVFQPKDRSEFGGKRRFLISSNSLPVYIGEENANKAVERALKSTGDKYRVKLRKHGTIDFYFK